MLKFEFGIFIGRKIGPTIMMKSVGDDYVMERIDNLFIRLVKMILL